MLSGIKFTYYHCSQKTLLKSIIYERMKGVLEYKQSNTFLIGLRMLLVRSFGYFNAEIEIDDS